MIVLLLTFVWLVVPPVFGYLIGRWWALSVALLFFPAFVVWNLVTPARSDTGEQVLELWFVYVLAFLFLSLPPLGLASAGIAARKWAWR